MLIRYIRANIQVLVSLDQAQLNYLKFLWHQVFCPFLILLKTLQVFLV